MGGEEKLKDHNYITIQGWMVNRLELSGNELMVYAIIYGFCQDLSDPVYRGSGKYFADSLRVSRRTVSTVLEELVKKGYIKKHEVFERNLKYCNYTIVPDFLPGNEKEGGMVNFSIPRKILPMEKTSIPMQNFPDSMENFSNSMENSANHIDLNNNINTTTAAGKPPDLIEEATPQGETAAAEVLSPKDIKTALLAINRSLLLMDDFYPRAAAFLSLNCLDRGYFLWLYNQVELRNPDSFEGLYFTLFFADNMVEKYKISKLPEEKPPPPEFKCPVCGTIHDNQDDKCPLCSLPKDSSPERIVLHRELMSLTPEKRNEYLEKEMFIFNSCSLHDYKKMQIMKDDLNKEFGIGVEYETPSRSYHS